MGDSQLSLDSNLFRAGDGIRTRDIQLGRLELYQLSYTRMVWRGKDSNLRRLMPADLQSAPFGHSGTPPLCFGCFFFLASRAGDRTRTDDLLLTRQLLYQLSYASDPAAALTKMTKMTKMTKLFTVLCAARKRNASLYSGRPAMSSV